MKNTKYQKIILVAVIGVIIYPSITFASWWNPFSWFKKAPTIPITQIQPSVPVSKIKVNTEINTKKVTSSNSVSKNPKPSTQSVSQTVSTPIISAPVQIVSTPNPPTNPQLLQVARQMLDTDDQGIQLVKNTYQSKYDIASRGQQICTTTYNNKVASEKTEAENLKMSERESGSGGLNTGALNQVDTAMAEDIETLGSLRDACLLSFNLPDSSILGSLNQLSSRVSSLRSNINTPEDAVTYRSELKSLSDDIVSTGGLVSNY